LSGETQLRLELRRPDFSLWLLTPSEPVIKGVAGQFDAAFGVFEGLGTVADWPEKSITWRKHREGNRLIWEADVTPALLDGTRGSCFFTKLDLASSYHQLRVRASDRWKTSFRSQLGQFEWNVVPFGL
jgi:hypothetical protein